MVVKRLPDYIGPCAFGLKMGVFLPGSDLIGDIVQRAVACHEDGLLADGDVLCITESVVARVQNNFVSTAEVARQIRQKTGVSAHGSIGVLFPIVSRNRFGPILEGIAKAVPQGRVCVQLSYPTDEVGNQTLDYDFVESLDASQDYISLANLGGKPFLHPITGVDYVAYYQKIIGDEGAEAELYFSNDPKRIVGAGPDVIIAAEIHNRERTRSRLGKTTACCITLQEICNTGSSWSEWGLLGSNMSANHQIKLAPRDGDAFVNAVQTQVHNSTGKRVQVLIYGDGAYKDPSTGIYELADPQTVFAATEGLLDRKRDGVKYKFLADVLYAEGKSEEEIEATIATKQGAAAVDAMESEGTTPRQLTDILASLADLVSGSADAGTPLILIKGFNG